MVKIHIEPDCGNAPRKKTLRDLVVAVADRDATTIRGILANDIAWALVGERQLHGPDAVEEWIAAGPTVAEITFGSLLTHGAGASVNGVLSLDDGTTVEFCHVLQFTGAAKTAKLKEVTTYLVETTS